MFFAGVCIDEIAKKEGVSNWGARGLIRRAQREVASVLRYGTVVYDDGIEKCEIGRKDGGAVPF